jgi:hypothetical protein
MRRLWLPPKHPLLNQEIITLADISCLPYIQLVIDDAEITTGAYWHAHNLAEHHHAHRVGRGDS